MTHAADGPDGLVRHDFLEIPVHLAGQRQVAVMDDGLHGVRDGAVEAQGSGRICGDVGVGSIGGEPNFEVIRDGSYAGDAFPRRVLQPVFRHTC